MGEQDIQNEARVWVARLRFLPAASEIERFQDWVTSSPRHEAVFRRIEAAFKRGDLSILAPTCDSTRAGPNSTSAAPRIVLPPGTWAVRILGAVLTRRAFRRRVFVVVQEMRAEYYDDMQAGRVWRARWVVVRGHFLMIWPWLCALCPRLVRKLF